MKADTLWRTLVAMISEELGIDEQAITADAHLVDDLGADSLDRVELIMRCEEDFKIEIDDDKADAMIYVRVFHHLTRRLVKP